MNDPSRVKLTTCNLHPVEPSIAACVLWRLPKLRTTFKVILCLLMLVGGHPSLVYGFGTFASDPALDPSEIALERVDNAGLDSVMTNSFGFGGTNGSMILSKYKG